MGQATHDFDHFEGLMVSPDLQNVVDELRMCGLDNQAVLAQLIEADPLPQVSKRINTREVAPMFVR